MSRRAKSSPAKPLKEPISIISIDGKKLSNFDHVHLRQGINSHHEFKVMTDQEVIEKQGAHTIDKSKNWLGKPIVITFNEREFVGVITDVQLVHKDGYDGKLVVSGYSKTILLEGGPHHQSWLKKGLGKIVKDITGAAGVEAEIAPVYAAPFAYQAQYGETHFQFLQRLAKQHNEWLYYDGVKLIFGKPGAEKPIELEYGKDMDSIHISIHAVPNQQNVFSYHSLNDKQETSKTKNKVDGLNELGDFAFKVSKDLYPILPTGFSSARINDKSEIDAVIQNKQSSRVAGSNVLTGSSDKQKLTVGSVIKVSAGMVKNKIPVIKNYGEFLITSITHDAKGTHEYSNRFEAISAGVAFLPEPDVELPVAQSQMATVLSNEDPEKKGRVEVQFQWQTGEMKTSWIRVMTPDAGSSNKVGANRGFVFIPEPGDQVMVGFRYNDPNRPFVMGSLFNGTTGAGGYEANKMKSLTTRSGSTILFDDDTGDGSITVSDPSGNKITLQGDGNVAINAPSFILLSSGKSSLQLDSSGTITMKGTEIEVEGTDTTKVHTAGNELVTSSGSADVNGQKVNVTGATETNIHANAKTTVSATGKVVMQGAMVSLN